MGPETRENLDALRGIAAQLNAANIEATVVVQAVDQYLGEELHIGVTAVSRPFETQRILGDGERETLVTSHLAFGRVHGKDRTYVLKATLEKDEWKEGFNKVVAEERTPWCNCPRELKLQSFSMLPELLGNLAGRVSEVALQTSRTVETVRELMEIMRQPPLASAPRVPDAFDGAKPGGDDGDDRPAQEEPSEESVEAAEVSLQELALNSAPNLFKRPRAKV
jgi:hypothetical protein